MKLIDEALKLLGVNEGSKEHKKIVDGYNKIDPLPRGYKLKVTDSWCAAFVSYLFYICGIVAFPFECSCYMLIEGAKKLGIWTEDDAYKPKQGDLVLYDWQDNGKGDNRGNPDHVGIVESVTAAGVLHIIEGNYNNAVGRRMISINGRYIRGFIRSSELLPTEKKKITAELINDIIRGVYGNGDNRRKCLEAAGYDYDEVRKKVNAVLKKK